MKRRTAIRMVVIVTLIVLVLGNIPTSLLDTDNTDTSIESVEQNGDDSTWDVNDSLDPNECTTPADTSWYWVPTTNLYNEVYGTADTPSNLAYDDSSFCTLTEEYDGSNFRMDLRFRTASAVYAHRFNDIELRLEFSQAWSLYPEDLKFYVCLADAAVKLPGITIIHSLKDARERVLLGGQANLNDEQLLYIGSMNCGEAVLHQGFTGPPVNVRVIDFQRSERIRPPSDQQVADLMAPFFILNPHLCSQNLPFIKRWEPDSVVLDNLIFLTESPDFREVFSKCLSQSKEHADAYVMGLVQKLVPDFTKATHYCNYLIDHLEEVGSSG
ncbi:hypothetical protein EU527_06270 [Candidatus Thorarchaeota archaeon]|nr:MAG: hypothetical protein EU527_06270 [Candidatus Thorarchaeota archaeon]